MTFSKFFILFLVSTLLLTTFICAEVVIDFPDESTVNFYTGNLTNLSELEDVNIPTPTDNQFLVYDTATSQWLAETISTTGNLSWNETYANDLYYDISDNILSYWNDTYSTFNESYADTLYSVINYGDDWNETYADELYYDISDNILSYWNDTYSTFNESYADTLYSVINYGDDWNETYADELYYDISDNILSYWNDTYSTFNESYADTLYSVINYGDDWNETYANTLYYDISDNILSYWNDTSNSFNESYADTLYADIAVVTDNVTWNESWADDLYVNIDGDVMTGDLNISNSDTHTRLNLNAIDSNAVALTFNQEGVGKWIIQTPYASDNLSFYSYELGTYALVLEDATGKGNFLGDLKVGDDLEVNDNVNIHGTTLVDENITTEDYFNGKFNWTTTDGWSSFDGSVLEFNQTKLEVSYFLVSAIEVVTGTGAGELADIQTYNRITYNVTEDDSDFELRVNFTGITEFTTLIVRHKTSIEEGHLTAIQIWDYGDSAWEGYGYLSEQTTSTMQTLGVYDDDDHISDGVVQVRFYQVEPPPNTAHIHQFDWVGLSKGFGTPVGAEVDPYWTSEKDNYYNTTQTDTAIETANTSMKTYVNAVNASMKTYVDAQDIAFNTSIVTYADAQDLLFNSSMVVYVDNQDTALNNSIVIYVDNLNASMKVYVDAQDVIFNNSIVTYVDEQDVAVNTTMKTYVDETFRLQDWDNFTGIPHATPSDGDTTHFSLADEIYDWVIGLVYATETYVDGLIASVGNWSADKGDYSTTAEAGVLYVNLSGDTMTGELNMSYNNITDISYDIKCYNSSLCWKSYVNASGYYIIEEV